MCITYWKPSTISGKSSRSRPLRMTYGHSSSRATSKFSLILVGRSSSVSVLLVGRACVCVCGPGEREEENGRGLDTGHRR